MMAVRSRTPWALALDGLWALLCVGLAIDSLRGAEWSVQSLIYFGLHAQAAFLFLRRAPPQWHSSSPIAYAVAVVAVLYAYLYRLDQEPPTILDDVGFAIGMLGSVGAILGTWSLGRHFGVFPIARGLTVDGAYRFVRHPIYLSYLIMDLGLLLAHPSLFNTSLFVAAIGLVLIRIAFEEAVLAGTPDHQAYRSKVPYRLVPGLY